MEIQKIAKIHSSFARNTRLLAQTDVQTRRFISVKGKGIRRASVPAVVSPTKAPYQKVNFGLGCLQAEKILRRKVYKGTRALWKFKLRNDMKIRSSDVVDWTIVGTINSTTTPAKNSVLVSLFKQLPIGTYY